MKAARGVRAKRMRALGWFLLLIAVLVYLLRTAERPRQGPIMGAPREVPLPRQGTRPAPGGARSAPHVFAEVVALPDADLETDLDPAATVDIRGVLLDTSSSTPISGADITLAFPVNSRNAWEAGTHPAALHARTDQDGRFELNVPSEWDRLSIYSCVGRIGEALAVFSGFVSLQDNLLLLGALPQVARGRLVSHFHFPYARTAVRLAPDGGQGYGKAILDDAGIFEAIVPHTSEPRHFDLWFSLEGVRGNVLARTSAESLLGDRLVDIECYPVKLTVVCTDKHGASVPSVTVRAGNAGEETAGLEEFQTDLAGEVTLLVLPGDVEICAARDGYWTSLATVPIARVMDAVHRVTLKEQDEEYIVRGRAVRPDGSPVSGAFVTSVPASRVDGVSLGNLSGTQSDQDGEFQLMSRFMGSSEIRAFHRRHGFTRAYVVSEYPAFLTLVFGDLGSVRVDVAYSFHPEEYTSGLPEYCLVDRYNHRSFSGYSKPPITLSDIPGGDYNLYVRFPGHAGYVQTSLVVEPGQERREEGDVVEGHWHAGELVRVNGESLPGAIVQARIPDWPDELTQKWGMSRTDREGRFEVFAGARELLTLDVTYDGQFVGTFQSSSGTENRFLVDHFK